MKNKIAEMDIVATEVYTSHYNERRIMRAVIYALAAVVLVQAVGLLHLADKHIVYRYIRINEMGQAAPISYNDLDYSPREGEIRTFLTEWATDRYARLRDTVAKTYPRNFYFLSDELANRLMTDDVRILRSIVGLKPELVRSSFTEFVQTHPGLNSKQIQFINMLTNHITRNGGVTMEKLYDEPFTRIHSDGMDGVFTNEKEAQELLALIQSFQPQRSEGTITQ